MTRSERSFVGVLFLMACIFLLSLILTLGKTDYFFVLPWLSPLFHGIGGFLTALLLYTWYLYLRVAAGAYVTPTWLLALSIFGGVATVGVLWEFWEFVVGSFFLVGFIRGLTDTLTDLGMDMVGGAIFCLYIALFSTYSTREKGL